MTQLYDINDHNLQPEGIQAPRFSFLTTNPSSMQVLMFQPRGTVIGDGDGVRVEDRDALSDQMRSFLNVARETAVDLAMCPEYSCPWEALQGAIDAGLWPGKDKLWALGCEGISWNDLTARVLELRKTHTVIFDSPPAEGRSGFLDCLCYLFSSERIEGGDANVILIQAKTFPMGGVRYEQDHLITGARIYRFGLPGENRLVGLLCSDVLAPNFRVDVAPQLAHQTLVLHLQLNSHPSSPLYRAYREHCCSENPRDSEVLCLNWAKGTQLLEGGARTPLVEEPRTCLFRDTVGLDLHDDVIDQNHRQGCFFSYWEPYRTAVFVFSPDPQLFHFRTSKPVLVGPAATAIRHGPLMAARYLWAGNEWEIDANDSDDRFSAYWLSGLATKYLEPHANETIDVERLIQFCIGLGIERSWSDWRRLASFRFDNDDTSRRLRLCWASEGLGFDFREGCKSTFEGFANIVANPENFSARRTAFKRADFAVGYRAAPSYLHHRNLHIEGGRSATAVFVGFNPSGQQLDRTKKGLLKALQDIDADTELLAIWYRKPDGSIADYMDGDVPSITSDPKEIPVAFDNTNP